MFFFLVEIAASESSLFAQIMKRLILYSNFIENEIIYEYSVDLSIK